MTRRSRRAMVTALVILTCVGCNGILGIDPPIPAIALPDGAVDVESADHTSADGGAVGSGSCDATLCDDFARSVPVPAGDPRWDRYECSKGSLEVNGGLVIDYPNVDAGLTRCALISKPSSDLEGAPSAVGHAHVEFDVTLGIDQSSPSPALFDLDVRGSVAGDGRFDEELIQFLVYGNGNAQLLAVVHDVVSDDFKTFELAAIFTGTRFIAPRAPCHVSVDVSLRDGTGTATSVCNGTSVSLFSKTNADAPTGFRGTATLTFGYEKTIGGPISAVQIAYRSLSLQLDP